MVTTTQNQQITVLPRPTWLDKAGMSKGINHDRQHLGIILAAGQTIKARQTNTAYTGNVNLRLLNDDGKTEASKSVGKDWADLKVDSVSVPFINTPYGSVMPVVQYEFPSNSKALPIYRKGDNQNTFFESWDRIGAEFALIESKYANILVPVVNKNDLKSMPGVSNIDGLIAHYESVFSFYNEMAGLSFEPQRATDLNCHNHYFLKADRHGAGAAYYSDVWTAESSASVKGFWLEPVATNWGSLHEIGHGYQGFFMGDKYLSTSEVWNNIYAACYQSVMLGDRKYKEGWLYDYGHQDRVENSINDYINNGKAVSGWDLRQKLYFLVMMVETAGYNAFAHFNQQVRLVSNAPGFEAGDYPLLDMLSDSFASVARKIDVTPYLHLVGGYLTPAQSERNLYSSAKAVYPLNRLLQGNDLTNAKQLLKVQSTMALVTVEQLLVTGQKGDVIVDFEIDEFSQIYGKYISFLDGARIARQELIQTPAMTFKDLPIGVYTVHLPAGRNRKYQRDVTYFIVKPGSNKEVVKFSPKLYSAIASQEIVLLGLGDDVFANVIINQSDRVVTVNVTRKDPHSYFPKQTYAEVVIKDNNSKELYRVTIPGTDATISHKELNFQPGYQVQVFHKEPHRVRLSPTFDGVIDRNANTNNFEILESGLKNQSLKNDPLKALLARIETAASALRSNYSMLQAESSAKTDIYLAINLFPSPQRENLLKQYADCLPVDNTAPAEGLGYGFTFGFNGIGDKRFLTVHLNLVSRKLDVSLAAGIAHHYFPDTYASLRCLDINGKELLYLDIKGTETQKAQQWSFPISGHGGEVLRIRHEEANSRLLIRNDMQGDRLSSRDNRQSYRVTTTGIDHIPE